ncbi:MAG: hypothetical protein FJ265_16620 [Planctomycetes bacterium]|nr:hypothetical protein [Planctomycetota bacterium]
MTVHDHDAHAGSGALQMGHHHVSSAALFAKVLVALLILTAITVGASRIHFGAANMLIAMFLACVKASLVMAFFMHLKWDTAINKIVFFGSFLFLSLLIVFTIADQTTRRMDGKWHVQKSPVQYEWVHPRLLTDKKD